MDGRRAKILVVFSTAQGQWPPEAEKRRIDVACSYSSEATRVDADFPDPSTAMASKEGHKSLDRATLGHLRVAQRMIRGEQEGYDACIPFGMNDFGVEIARSACRIPIVGQTQATYCMAAMMVDRFGIISYQSSSHAEFYRQINELGFLHMLVGMGAAEMNNLAMAQRRQELIDRFVAEGKRLVREGAELIVCHGMAMCPVEFRAEELAGEIGAPVLEGMGCAVAMAEAWLGTGTPYSDIRYPRVP
jgi:allantoin racemase